MRRMWIDRGRECAAIVVVVVNDRENERLRQPFDTTPYDAEGPAAPLSS